MAYNLEKCLNRVINAITYRDKIVVFSNNDLESVLGMTSLLLTLRYLNADVEYLTPNELTSDRKLTRTYIDNYIKAFGAKLVILVGCDFMCKKDSAIMKQNGIDTVVLKKDAEHYQENYIVNETNNTLSNIENVTDSILVFELIEAISSYYRTNVFYKYTDLIMLAIINSDIPLKDINRVLVKLGVDRLHNSNNYGIRALIEINRIEEITLTSLKEMMESVKPSLNVLGRMDDSKILVELFTTDSIQRARQIAKYIVKDNRQKLAVKQ